MNYKGVIDDGTVEVPLVNKFGKPICKIYFRPADYSIVDRFNALMQDFESIVEPLKGISIKADGTAEFEEGWAALKEAERNFKDKLNALLDMEDADAIFEKRNPFSSVGGTFFCEHVLNAIGEIITRAIQDETEKSGKRMEQYLSGE